MFSYLRISKITCLIHLFFFVSLSKAKKIHGLWPLISRGQCNFIRDFYGFLRHDEENWVAALQCMLGSHSYPRIRVEHKIPCVLICISYLFVKIYPRTPGFQVPLVSCLYRRSYYFHTNKQRTSHKQLRDRKRFIGRLPSPFCNQINK